MTTITLSQDTHALLLRLTIAMEEISELLQRCERNPVLFKDMEDISCLAVRKE
jgi:hypothetical protein